MAHKIKPSLANMQIDILKEPIAQLEALSADSKMTDNDEEKYELVRNVLTRTILSLKKDINHD